MTVRDQATGEIGEMPALSYKAVSCTRLYAGHNCGLKPEGNFLVAIFLKPLLLSLKVKDSRSSFPKVSFQLFCYRPAVSLRRVFLLQQRLVSQHEESGRRKRIRNSESSQR